MKYLLLILLVSCSISNQDQPKLDKSIRKLDVATKELETQTKRLDFALLEASCIDDTIKFIDNYEKKHTIKTREQFDLVWDASIYRCMHKKMNSKETK